MSRTFEAYFFCPRISRWRNWWTGKKEKHAPFSWSQKNAVKDTIEIFCDFQKNSYTNFHLHNLPPSFKNGQTGISIRSTYIYAPLWDCQEMYGQWQATMGRPLCDTWQKLLRFNKYNIVLCKPRKICYLYAFEYHSNILFEKAGLQAHHSAMECMKEVLFLFFLITWYWRYLFWNGTTLVRMGHHLAHILVDIHCCRLQSYVSN